jgi:hypothetical protein
MTKKKYTIMVLMPVENFFAWCSPESLGRKGKQIKRRGHVGVVKKKVVKKKKRIIKRRKENVRKK